MTSSKNRTFSRVHPHVHAAFRAPDGATGSGTVDDLSFNGLRLVTDAAVEPGTLVALELHLESGTDRIVIGTRSEVVRCDPDGIAVHFVEVEGEGWEHLERLVLFNSRDTGRVEAELRLHADVVPPLGETTQG